MGWDEVDEKLEKASQSYFVTCETEEELKLIAKTVKEAFPHLEESEIDLAIQHCCETLSSPRARHRFLDCLRRQLEQS
jgi:hypothetical protein